MRLTSNAHQVNHQPPRLTHDAQIALLQRMVGRIVTAYIARVHVPAGELPRLIRTVSDAVTDCMTTRQTAPSTPARIPAVPVSRSVSDETIICLEDGKAFKSLRRHLSSKYGLTPDQYRTRWGLSADYPMVAPAYARQRSALAKTLGLGRRRADSVARSA